MHGRLNELRNEAHKLMWYQCGTDELVNAWHLQLPAVANGLEHFVQRFAMDHTD